jgi:sortase A
MRKQREGKKQGSALLTIVIILLFLVGLGIYLYPTVSDLWNKYRNEQLINHYSESVSDLGEDEKAAIWAEAKAYNAQHTENVIVDAFNEDDEYVLSHPYDTMLDPNGDGLMGDIEIPKLNLKLAIYHGLGTDVLEKGIGHVEGTSLPIGGESSHAVLAGHRGLPTAKLFTDLDQMELGDIFLIHVMDKTLAYKVDQIKTVLPEETEDLDIIPGEDHVTLVTCTPYGVNTHRLLVRGIRTEYTEEIQEQEKAINIEEVNPLILLAIGAAVFDIILILIIVITNRRDKKRLEEEAEEDRKREELYRGRR